MKSSSRRSSENFEKKNASKNLKGALEGITQRSLEDYNLVIALKHITKPNSKRYLQMEDRIQVWSIDNRNHLPYGRDKKIFEEIKQKIHAHSHVGPGKIHKRMKNAPRRTCFSVSVVSSLQTKNTLDFPDSMISQLHPSYI